MQVAAGSLSKARPATAASTRPHARRSLRIVAAATVDVRVDALATHASPPWGSRDGSVGFLTCLTCNPAASCPQKAPSAVKAPFSQEKVRIAVLGASGYTGEEVVRLLSLHPTFRVTVLTGDRQAGKVSMLQGIVCSL